MKKSAFIKTFGCQMNVYDSERMSDILGSCGYDLHDTADDADLIILNTCHIREKAAEKVYSELGRMRLVQEARAQKGAKTLIAVAGCVAQAEGKEILRRARNVDMVIGPQTYHLLPDLLRRHQNGERGLVETAFPEDDKFQSLPKPISRSPTAFLTVQEGCDKFCSFCVVPYTRGSEFSRPVSEILTDAQALLASGVKEITLIGQNVNAYHGEGPDGTSWSLAKLIDLLSQEETLKRLRYTTSHPRDMSSDLIAAHGQNEKLMPYLHLPFQSGSDRILKAMNRGHTGQDYLDLIEQIRAACPHIALSTDIIVGFPGETDADFEATMEMVRAVKFAQAYSFKYSPRPGTPASGAESQVPEQVKTERLAALQAVLSAQQEAFNLSCFGKTMSLLLEKPGRKEGQLMGRSPYLQPVGVDTKTHQIGEIVQVEITHASTHSLVGCVIDENVQTASKQAVS